MLETALKLINKIEEHGYVAYIVGGFVRDHLLKIPSNDIDICTNAKPSEIREIFKNACLPNEAYGSITVVLKKVRFEITTFRREITYINNRKPVEFEYIDDLLSDLKRRDFRINTICMDSDGKIVDLLNGRDDLNKREIYTVGNSHSKFKEDALRILRAIRFATNLDFKLSDEVKQAIKDTKHYVKNISYQRKKEELNKIFASIHVKYGIKLLIELGLDKELELYNLSNITNFDDLMGIWAQLNVENLYPFSKNEKEIIDDIRKVLSLDNLNYKVLYKYGLYVNSVAAGIKGIDKKNITYEYNKLPIKDKNEIVINGNDIMEILHVKPSEHLRKIIDDIEDNILVGNILNNKEEITKYILDNYK